MESITNSNTNNLNYLNSQFPQINTKREYIDLRLKLENTFLLFLAYEVDSEDNDFYLEFLGELQSKFKDYVKIVLFTNKSDVKLLDVLKKEDESEISSTDSILFPRAVLCHPHLTDAQVVTNLDPFELYKIVEDASNFYQYKFNSEKQIVFDKIKKILDSYPVVVFIKGSPHDPFCKFSKSFINLIKETGIKYKSFDIFRDESLRSYLRLYSGWKTYPQLYINGKIIGGVDVLKDLITKEEFMNLVPVECKKEGVINSIEALINQNRLVVFGKGSIENPKCKSSSEAYDILTRNKFEFKIFDVLKDEMARDLIKSVYGYNFYPQVFVDGKLLGGLKLLRQINSAKTIIQFIPASLQKE